MVPNYSKRFSARIRYSLKEILGVLQAIGVVRQANDTDLPTLARQVLLSLVDQLERLKAEIAALDRQMIAWHRANADSRRLATIPGIGHITASAIVAAAGDGKQFQSAREFAAWIGLVPRQSSSGGKERWDASRRRATSTCVGFWYWGPRRICDDESPNRVEPQIG